MKTNRKFWLALITSLLACTTWVLAGRDSQLYGTLTMTLLGALGALGAYVGSNVASQHLDSKEPKGK